MNDVDGNVTDSTQIVFKPNQKSGTFSENGQVPSSDTKNTKSGAADQARRILEKLGAKFFYKNGATLLHQCIEKPPTYVYVLANGGVPVNIQNSDGDTALHLSVRAGNYGVTLALLQCSADINSRNKLGQTPLDIADGSIQDLLNRYKPGVIQAVLQGRYQVLDRLCKHTWCSVGTVVKEGKTLMQLAMSRSEKEPNVQHCCRILHDYRTTSDVVHAVLSEDVDLLKTLLTTTKGYFVNVRYRDKLGTTLLSHAIESNNLAIAKLLVDADCRINRIRIREHDTVQESVPLCHKALQKGVSLEMIRYVYTAQEETERLEKDWNGNTMILRAIEEDLPGDVIHWLIKADGGRCLADRNKEGFIPREIAAQRSRMDIINIIDKYVSTRNRNFSLVYLPVNFYGKHNINQQQFQADELNGDSNNDQYSQIERRGVVMFEAAARGDLSEVKTLNTYCFRDKNGYTALTRAIVFNQPEVAKYLCTSRPELKFTADNHNRYPLHYACALPNNQMVTFAKILLEKDPEVIETRVDKDGRYPVEYKTLRGSQEMQSMLYDARTLDAYGQRGPPLAEWPEGAESSGPEWDEF